MVAEMDLQEEKWVQMNGKLVPIIKLERLARDDLDGCIKWYKYWLERSNSPSQKSCLRRWSKNMNKALKRSISIQFIRYTSPSLPPPFVVKEISTDICDSSDELIPSYFFEEMVGSTNILSSQAEEVSIVVNSIPSAVNEEEVCLNLWSNEFKIWEVSQFMNELLVRNCVNFFSRTPFFLHSKILGMACIYFKLDDSRLIFDRGKYFGTLILSSGFNSDYGLLDSIIHVFSNDTEIQNDSNLLVKMSKSESGSLSSVRDDFLLHLHEGKMFVKTFPSDIVCFEYNFFFNHTPHTRKSSQLCFQFADKVFDRGKEFQLLRMLFFLICESEDYFGTNTSCVIFHFEFTFMDTYYEKFAYEPIVEFGYCVIFLYDCSHVSLFVKEGYSHANSQLFENSPQQHHIPWTFVILQVPRQLESGNAQKLFHQLLVGFGFCSYRVFNSDAFILHVGSISISYYTKICVPELISMYRFESSTSFSASILLVFVTTSASGESGKLFVKFSLGNSIPLNTYLFIWMQMSDIKNVHELYHLMLEMWEEENYLFQLKYVLPEALLGCQFDYLVVGFIRIRKKIFKIATIWSNQVIPVLNSYATLVRDHDCSIRLILTILRRCFQLLRMSFFLLSSRLTSGLYVKRDGTREQYFCYYCSAVFNIWTTCTQQHSFDTSSKLYHGIFPMHLSTSVFSRVASLIDSTKLKFFLKVWETQVLQRVFQILKMQLLVGYLRWKFRLVPSGLLSTISVSWTFAVIRWMTDTQLIIRVIKFLHVQLLWGCLRWEFRSVSSSFRSITSVVVFTWIFTELLEEFSYTVGGMRCCSGWVVFRVDNRRVLNFTGQGWKYTSLFYPHSSIEVKLLILVKWQLVLTSGAHLAYVLFVVVTKRVGDLHCPISHKFKTSDDRGTLSTVYLLEIIIRGSGLLVDLNRSTTTLCQGQFFVRLGTAVCSLAPKCLPLFTQTFFVWIWADYLRWKFRLVQPGFWSVTNVSWFDSIFLSVVCLDISWTHKNNLFCTAVAHTHIVVVLNFEMLGTVLQWDATSWISVVIRVIQPYEVPKAQERFSKRHQIFCVEFNLAQFSGKVAVEKTLSHASAVPYKDDDRQQKTHAAELFPRLLMQVLLLLVPVKFDDTELDETVCLLAFVHHLRYLHSHPTIGAHMLSHRMLQNKGPLMLV